MKPLHLVLPLALGLCTAHCTPPKDANAPGGSTSSKGSAPDFELPELKGGTVRLSDYLDGKHVVLLNFWSTTCDPCMAEMPHLVELYKKHKDAGFVVLSVAADGPESRAQVSSTVQQKEMIFPVLLDEETTQTARFNPKRELPFNVLIGKSGAIIMKRPGYQGGDEKLITAEVEKALAE
jgi:peroxiredoxin